MPRPSGLSKGSDNFEILNAVTQELKQKQMLWENRMLAAKVRSQHDLLKKKDGILRALEAKDPGITKVNWSPDGSILMDEDYVLDNVSFG